MFVFSIAVGAPKITTLMLDSYIKYHNTPIHIFCSEKDRELLSVRYNDQEIIKYEIVNKNTEALFESGHLGTSKIYTDLIEDPSVDDNLIHIDTDLLFRGEAISLIQDKFREGYSLVGPMRLYKNNPNNRRDCDYRPHVTQTYFFGFDKSKITKRSSDIIHRMAQGQSVDGQPVIDFFDPLAFDILQNGGKVFHLDRLDVGGFSEDATLHNSEGFSHEDLDWGSKLIHFGGGGTGERVCRGEGLNIPKGYADWALERYKMISNLFGLEDTVFGLSETKSKLFKKIMDNIKTSVSDYDDYRNICRLASMDDSLFSCFKQDPRYTAILEHCPKSQGDLLANWCSSNINFSEEKLKLAKWNDTQGSPSIEDFPLPIGRISPSSLRYFKCLLDIEDIFGDLSGKNIIEIGPGYGGLCGILKRVFNIQSYTLVDLPDSLLLAKRYLNDSSNNYVSPEGIVANGEYDLVISNYAFTECNKEIQDIYIDRILKRSKGGYITYNNISDIYGVESYSREYLKQILDIQELPEYPLSAKDNCILFWNN